MEIQNMIQLTGFGQRLKYYRDSHKLSQSELANLIDAHHSIIGKYERDEVRPSIDVVMRIAQVLKTKVSYLIGESEEDREMLDPVMQKRMKEILELPEKERESLLLIVDAFLRDFRIKEAYSSFK